MHPIAVIGISSVFEYEVTSPCSQNDLDSRQMSRTVFRKLHRNLRRDVLSSILTESSSRCRATMRSSHRRSFEMPGHADRSSGPSGKRSGALT